KSSQAIGSRKNSPAAPVLPGLRFLAPCVAVNLWLIDAFRHGFVRIFWLSVLVREHFWLANFCQPGVGPMRAQAFAASLMPFKVGVDQGSWCCIGKGARFWRCLAGTRIITTQRLDTRPMVNRDGLAAPPIFFYIYGRSLRAG